jgi:antitoxin MazE
MDISPNVITLRYNTSTMSTTIARVRRIGNSKGILFSKSMLEESGIIDTVQITVKNKVIMISRADEKPVKTWADFKPVKKEKADFIPNKFDSTDWTWE